MQRIAALQGTVTLEGSFPVGQLTPPPQNGYA